VKIVILNYEGYHAIMIKKLQCFEKGVQQARSQVLRFDGEKCIFRGARLSFLLYTKFPGHVFIIYKISWV